MPSQRLRVELKGEAIREDSEGERAQNPFGSQSYLLREIGDYPACRMFLDITSESPENQTRRKVLDPAVSPGPLLPKFIGSFDNEGC